ncbi:hypothetical protein Nepgr_028313 [Nepenthes gracilis]|uniref:Uncharacterized protein n=1 Tax=Nepenthes gracilis TaxID=150966 RepID=A0AAD3TBG6_NEPGR|nr:hypothetical protein Nepgr_028313 [Nepenthes gracilis]
MINLCWCCFATWLNGDYICCLLLSAITAITAHLEEPSVDAVVCDVLLSSWRQFDVDPPARGRLMEFLITMLMMPLGEAHEGADGNPLYVLLMRFTLPALELKMMRLDSVLEHTDIGPCGAPV